MDNFKNFIEDLLDSKIKDLNRLSGGASAETYKICLSDHKNYILRKTPDSAESKLAISKKLEAKIQKIVQKNNVPVPRILKESKNQKQNQKHQKSKNSKNDHTK